MFYKVAREENCYTTYQRNDTLLFKHNVFLAPEASIEQLVEKPREGLDNIIAGLKEDELAAFEAMQAAAAKWDAICAERLLVQEAIRYQVTPVRPHTNNKWVEKERPGGGYIWDISNATYSMYIEAYGSTNSRISHWTVIWEVRYNCPRTHKSTWVAGCSDKRLPNKEAALKYVEGRKKAYTKLFQEECPPIPADKADLFKIGNKLMQGYTVASQNET